MFFKSGEDPNQFQNGDFHHTLVEVCRLVLHHLYGNDLVSCNILAFHHLTKGTLTQNVQNEVPAGHELKADAEDQDVHELVFLVSQPIVHVENVVIIHVVVSIIVGGLTGLRQHTSWVVR